MKQLKEETILRLAKWVVIGIFVSIPTTCELGKLKMKWNQKHLEAKDAFEAADKIIRNLPLDLPSKD